MIEVGVGRPQIYEQHVKRDLSESRSVAPPPDGSDKGKGWRRWAETWRAVLCQWRLSRCPETL